jgi:hypothetical protein
MTPLTPSETHYEAALKYIGAAPDNNSIESRKCRLLGNIGPDGEGFGPAFRTALGLDADSFIPEFSRTVQAWAMWGQFVETGKGRQGDTVVTEDFVGIVDSIGEHEIRAIGFQNGKVRIATVSRPKSMIRRAFEPQSLATERIGKVVNAAVAQGFSQNHLPKEPVTPPTVDELKAEDTTEETVIPTPERKKPGRPPKLQTV